MSRRKALANNPLAPSSLNRSVELAKSLAPRPPVRADAEPAWLQGRKRWYFGPAEVLETPEGLTIRIDSNDAAEQLAALEEILRFRTT